jgi:hypothetical protein
MVETTVVRTIRVRGTSEGIDKLTSDLGKLAGAQTNVAVVAEDAARRTLSAQEAYRRQTMAVDEAARSQARIARETKIADAAQREGLINQTQHAERLQVITQRYGTVIDATKRFGTQTGLAGHEVTNLGRQMADVGTQLASGASPFMIMAQQGPQIADIFLNMRGTVGGFFTQALGWAARFATSTAGIVTGVAAIGAAAVYAAYQFTAASKTVQEALEEENRLLKEGKALIDARTSAEARAALQGRGQTQFEIVRNALDLQLKLNQAMQDAADIAARRSTTPMQVPGEMGEVPTGYAPLKGGLAEIATAMEKLRAAQAAGLPGLKDFNAELGRIGLAHPELAQTVEEMIKLGRSGFEIEQAALRAKAMADALAGVATNAQLAAVGLGSIAQFKLNNMRAEEAAAATERMAVATLQMAQAYPGMSIDAVKQLDALNAQLSVAEAVGQMAQIEAQHRARIVELSKALGATEATRIAGLERAVALAQIEAQHKQTMVALQGQLSVAEQVTGIGQINAQYEATVASLTLQIGQTKAIEQAEVQRATAIAQVNAEADRMLHTLQQEGELIRASSDAERDRIAARHTYDNLVAKGVDSAKAEAVAKQQQANAEEKRARAEQQRYDDTNKNIKTAADAWKAYSDNVIGWGLANQLAGEANARAQHAAAEAMREQYIAAVNVRRAIDSQYEAAIRFSGLLSNMHYQWSTLAESVSDVFSNLEMGKDIWQKGGSITQFNPEGYTSQTPQTQAAILSATAKYGEGGFTQDPTLAQLGFLSPIPNAQGLEKLVNSGAGMNALLGGLTSANTDLVQATGQILSRMTNLLPEDQKAAALQQQISALQGTSTLAGQEMLKQLTDQLQQLTRATEENTSATQSMTDVLSPFYSSDPRRTYLGFRAFAGGGIMTDQGAMPLNNNIATSRQVAVFGEGATPEAFVPVPSGRIPVDLNMPANSNRPITVNINVAGDADANTVNALKQTAFQQAQTLRRVMS